MQFLRSTTWDDFSGQFFCIAVAMCDLVHDVEAIFHILELLTASVNLF